MPYGRRPDGIFFRMEANRAAYAQPGSLRLTACHRTMMGDHLRMNLFDEDYGVNYCGGAVRYHDTILYRVQSTPRTPVPDLNEEKRLTLADGSARILPEWSDGPATPRSMGGRECRWSAIS